jgi:hypothetical protein
MLAAAGTIFLQFHPTRIIAPIFFSNVIAFFAHRTRQNNMGADRFLSHNNTLKGER